MRSFPKDLLGGYAIFSALLIDPVSSLSRLSNWTMGPNATFYYQHDARLHDNDTMMSIFDNAGVEVGIGSITSLGSKLTTLMQNRFFTP